MPCGARPGFKIPLGSADNASPRYIRAFEVGQSGSSPKYDLAVKLRTLKNGPVVRNRLQLPHPVKTGLRICVICPPDSPIAAAALKAGAVLVGEENVFEAVKEGRINFDRCLCHTDSTQKLNKSGVGKILGPRGLMPSAKFGTVVKDVRASVRSLAGGSEYREKLGVIRMAVGQLGFSPEEMQSNIKAFMVEVKSDIAKLSDKIGKEIHEVVSAICRSFLSIFAAESNQVLSSTHAPGFSLNGDFRSPSSPPTRDLTVL